MLDVVKVISQFRYHRPPDTVFQHASPDGRQEVKIQSKINLCPPRNKPEFKVENRGWNSDVCLFVL